MKRSWYAVCLVPFVLTAIVAGVLIASLISEVEHMQRGVVPGSVALALEPGDYVIYAESHSKVGGIVYHADHFSLRCALASASGAPVVLDSPTGTTTYSFGDYAGSSIHTFTIGSGGAYTLDCQSDGTPRVVVAVGHGIGSKLVTALVLFFAGCIASVIGFVLMYRRRKQWLATRGQ